MMFSATLRSGTRLTSWYTVLMPSVCACCGERGAMALPASVIVPESGRYTPVSTLTSVDLPAPFSPSKA